MDDRVKNLERIKESVKTPEFKEVIDKKIDKIKKGEKIYK